MDLSPELINYMEQSLSSDVSSLSSSQYISHRLWNKILLYSEKHRHCSMRGCIQTFPDWVDNEIDNSNKHSLRSNTKGYGVKTH
jgi:hypothetical protein